MSSAKFKKNDIVISELHNGKFKITVVIKKSPSVYMYGCKKVTTSLYSPFYWINEKRLKKI